VSERLTDDGATSARSCEMTRTPDDDVMSVQQAAAFLRVGVNQLYDAIGRGEVPHVRIGKTIRLSREALHLMMRGRTSGNRTKET